MGIRTLISRTAPGANLRAALPPVFRAALPRVFRAALPRVLRMAFSPVPVVAVDASTVRVPAGPSTVLSRSAVGLRQRMPHGRKPVAVTRAAADVRRRLAHGRPMALRHATTNLRRRLTGVRGAPDGPGRH